MCTLIAELATKVNIVTEQGLSKDYNGFDIVHDWEYIHINVSPYIDKVIPIHGW
jgi:hypothetical protein